MKLNLTLHLSPDASKDGREGRERRRLERIKAAIPLVQQGMGSRRIAAVLGLAKVTAMTYRRIIVRERLVDPICGCGRDISHQGYCSYRAQFSDSRRKYLKACAQQSQERRSVIAARVRERKEDSAWWWLIKQLAPHPIRERIARRPRQRLAPLATCYPYIREGEEIELLLLVNEAVPKTIQHEVRADVCQELLLSILTGELTRENFTDHVGEYVRVTYKQLGDRYKEISLDAPLYRDGESYTLLDTLAAPEVSEDEVYSVTRVRRGMPYAGPLADCQSAEDLAERLSDHWEANRLLHPTKPNYGIHVADRRTDNRDIPQHVQGAGHMKISSYVRHSGWQKITAFAPNARMRDAIMFSVQDYQQQRAEEESEKKR